MGRAPPPPPAVVSELRSKNRNSNEGVMLGVGVGGEHLLFPSFGVTRASTEIPVLAAAGGGIRCVSRGKCNASAYPQLPFACPQRGHRHVVNLSMLLQRHSVLYTNIIHLFSPPLAANNNEEFEALQHLPPTAHPTEGASKHTGDQVSKAINIRASGRAAQFKQRVKYQSDSFKTFIQLC